MKPFGERAFTTRVAKIRDLEEEINRLSKERDALKEELKNSMVSAGESVHQGKDFIARLTEVSQTRFDSKKLKVDNFDLWKTYSYSSSYVKFTIN